jgi:uncharacterized protein YciI
MRFVAILTDKPGTQELRAANTTAHETFIAANRDRIVLSGAMRETESGPARGGLWVIEAADKSAAEAIIHEDPFFKAGMRGTIELYHWGAAGKIG